MLHGSGPGATGWSNFAHNIPELDRHFHVIAPDMPGWGDSDQPTPSHERDHVLDLIALLDHLNIAQAALVGNSMGGMTAIRATLNHPHRVSHLITLGTPAPGPNIFTPHGPTEGMKALVRAGLEPTVENFTTLVQTMTYTPRPDREKIAQNRYRNAIDKPAHLASFHKLFNNPPTPPFTEYFALGDRISDIETPTLAIHGRDDRVVPVEASLRLIAHIPNSRLLIINRCGHWAQTEHPHEINRTIANFIDNAGHQPQQSPTNGQRSRDRH